MLVVRLSLETVYQVQILKSIKICTVFVENYHFVEEKLMAPELIGTRVLINHIGELFKDFHTNSLEF